MIDSHCHLADEAFSGDLPAVVQRAADAGVQRAMCILSAGDEAEAEAARRVRTLWPDMRFAVGVHPHNAAQFAGRSSEAATVLADALAAEGAIAIGEIGLDYHYDFSPRDLQQVVFGAQVELARQRSLPIVIHTREATDDTFRLLEEAGGREVKGIVHCFTGDIAMARTALDLGLHVSFAGIVTFPRSTALREAAAFVPADRLLIETDAPYLAPVPHRGKRNEPAFVAQVLDTLAGIRRVPAGELAAQLVGNFDALMRPTVSQ
jgi:TatD DNase family protein